MITSVFLNLIYLLFPLACYLIYLVYSKVTYKKEKNLFFTLSLFSSYYLCARFGVHSSALIFLINIPLILSLYKKDLISSIGLSILISYLMSNFYGINVTIFIAEYSLIILVRYLLNYNSVNTFVIFHTLFNLLITFIVPCKHENIISCLFILLAWVIIYILLIFVVMLYKKLELIVNMYHSLEDITKEKTLYQSLFKITHEIKNPLAVCKGYLDMFDAKDPIKSNRYVGIINQEIDRTLLLLKDFSDVTKLKVDKNIMDINMLLEDVCDEAKLILKNNIVFKYVLCENEINIYGDYNRLKQVLINVIKNAMEAIKGSGEIKLISKFEKGQCIIWIRDNGEGMDKETKKKIGTPFYTTKKSGTGLGVCFSQEIIKMHGGSIKYISKEHRGTSVKITLPLKNTATS